MKIIIISAVRNEGKYITHTIESMINQTTLPHKWVIVNDGSTDNTEIVVKKYLNDYPFIEYIHLPDRGYRKPAQGVIETFYQGYNCVKHIDHDIVAKFDADLKFPPDTLESIIAEFRKNPKLGITGGTRYERHTFNGQYKKVLVPKGFVGGPYKFYRKECFEDIGGLIVRAGWDGVDSVRANMKNWQTGEIETLKIYHLKPTGTASGEGLKRACEKYGDVSYYMGGYFWYFLFRVVGRSLLVRNPLVGYYMFAGYLKSMNDRAGRESKEFRKYLKKQQIENTKYWIRRTFNPTANKLMYKKFSLINNRDLTTLK
jgi:glycosyltransferase involved in cell wall biosynthesis